MKDCVSLEIAKKLKEAGWKQPMSSWGYTHPWGNLVSYYRNVPLLDDIAAPTIGELLEALKADVPTLRLQDEGFWSADAGGSPYHYSKNPADALALLWMALKEKNLV